MEKKEEQKVEEVKIENNDTQSKSEPQKNPGLYTAGLVCSIVGLCLFWSVWIGLICGILGIVFGAVTYKKTNSNAPIILGSFATGLAIIMIIIYPILVKNIFDKVLDDYEENYSERIRNIEDRFEEQKEKMEQEFEEEQQEKENENKKDITNEQNSVQDDINSSMDDLERQVNDAFNNVMN